jgi:hypothetical protein
MKIVRRQFLYLRRAATAFYDSPDVARSRAQKTQDRRAAAAFRS